MLHLSSSKCIIILNDGFEIKVIKLTYVSKSISSNEFSRVQVILEIFLILCGKI
jgi:hypothetical protein